MAEITGTEGADSLQGTSERDTISGLAGDDTIFGGADNDFIAPGPGNDSIDGGEGFDYLDYSVPSASQGVVVDLSLGQATDAWGDTDTFTGIENAKGGPFDDTLIGDSGDNSFDPGAGNDVINGGTGINSLNYFFSDGFQGVVVDLVLGQATDDFNNIDTLSNITRVFGSNFDDTRSVICIAGNFIACRIRQTPPLLPEFPILLHY